MDQWLANYPDTVSHEIDIPYISIPQMLEETVENYGDKEAISFYGKSISYRQLYGMTIAFASALQKKAFKKGTGWLLCCQTVRSIRQPITEP